MRLKKVEIIIYPFENETQRIEYKGRVIQIYPHGELLCFFVMKEDGNDDKEFFCLEQAIKYIENGEEMKIRIKTYNGELPSYLTMGEEYAAINVVDCFDRTLLINGGIEIHINNCEHLNGGSWEIIND